MLAIVGFIFLQGRHHKQLPKFFGSRAQPSLSSVLRLPHWP